MLKYTNFKSVGLNLMNNRPYHNRIIATADYADSRLNEGLADDVDIN